MIQQMWKIDQILCAHLVHFRWPSHIYKNFNTVQPTDWTYSYIPGWFLDKGHHLMPIAADKCSMYVYVYTTILYACA